MKKIISLILVFAMLMGTMVFADEKTTVYYKDEHVRVLIGSVFTKGNNSLLDIKSKEEASNKENHMKYKMTYSHNVDSDYILNIKGKITLNDKAYPFDAEGLVQYKTINDKKIERTILVGEINVSGSKKKMLMEVEKFEENIYITMTINSISDDEGFVVLESGISSLSKEDFETENMNISSNNNSSMSFGTYGYGQVDVDYEEVTGYLQTGIKEIMYLEDDIKDFGNSGKMMTRIHGYTDHIWTIFENDYIIRDVEISMLNAEFDALDNESSFGNHSPSESYSGSQVENLISAILGDLGVPSSIRALVSGIGNSINVTWPNDLYKRYFRIYPDTDDIFEDGGYTIEVFVNKDLNALDDDFTTKSWLAYRVYHEDYYGMHTFTVYTDTTYNTVDLANY